MEATDPDTPSTIGKQDIPTMTRGTSAELIFDGACTICRYWVHYWQQLTGEQVRYRPYQQAAAEYAQISQQEFQRSIQLVDPAGQRYQGAEAVFRLLALAPGHGHWLWLYHRMPGFQALSEAAYRLCSRQRGLLTCLSHLLWGRTAQASHYTLVCRSFMHLLGWVYLCAFLSFGSQVRGLIGAQGVLPLGAHLAWLQEQLGSAAYSHAPTLFWLNSSDLCLQLACLLGAVLAGAIILGVTVRAATAGCFLCYLSLSHAGQIFTNFQWDALLLEAGFLAIWLSPRSLLWIWLYRWLLFRFIFMSGVVKLLSGEPLQLINLLFSVAFINQNTRMYCYKYR